ncbi:hypothetical protein TNCV_1626141 [Trichonephila clavipes]|nr:hypothetical protein TNCV_3607031 [Trichonephila clavipes]GFU81949.1 hypothetical protein TNCV_1626141 [Trichonephila clavipes]
MVFPLLKLHDKWVVQSDYIWRLNVLFKMSGDKFNKIKAGKSRKRCTTSVDDRTKTLCFRDKRISWTSIGSDVSDACVSVSSKTMRSRLADVRPKGRIPRRKPYLILQQR